MEKQMSSPNFVVFQVDQLSALALKAYGNETVIAPNIDRLCKMGVTFKNTYCNSPICGPSRSSMLSGQLATEIGVFDNAAEWPATLPTLMHYLRAVGYFTTLSGKMHFVGPDQLHGFNERLTTDLYPADFSWTSNWKGGPRDAPTGINMRAVTEAGPCVRSLQVDYDEEATYQAKQKIYDFARTPEQNPYLLFVSLTHPHSPFTATQAHWDLYDHDKIDMPKVASIPLEEMDQHSAWLYFSHGRDRLDVTDEHVRNARHAYYGMISYLDDKLGEVIEALEATDQFEDAIFVFISDHGDMMGERGMWYKQCFWENSARVPMVICGPGIPAGKVVEENVSLIDLFPTLLSFAGADLSSTANEICGRPLQSLIFGEDEDWPDVVISEYTDMGVCAPCRMIREGKYKLFFTHGHPNLLFDLEADPTEVNNLGGRGEFAQIEADLLKKLLRNWVPHDVHKRVLESQAMRHVIAGSTKNDVKRDNWSYEFRNGDKDRYVRGSGASGTNAVKGRARFPMVEPMKERDAPPVPDKYMT